MEHVNTYSYKKIKYISIGFAAALHILALLIFIIFFKFPERFRQLTKKTEAAPVLIKKAPPQPPKAQPKPPQKKPIQQSPKQPTYVPQIRPLEEEMQKSVATLNPQKEQRGEIRAADQKKQTAQAPGTPSPAPTTPEKQEKKEPTASPQPNTAQKLVKALKRRKNSKAKWFKTSVAPETTPEKKENKTFAEQIYDRRFANQSQEERRGVSRAQEHAESFARELYTKKVARALCIASRNSSLKINSNRMLNITVPLMLEIEKSGKLRDASLIRTSGNYSIDDALLKLTRQAHIPSIPSDFEHEVMQMPMQVHIQTAPGTHPLILHMVY